MNSLHNTEIILTQQLILCSWLNYFNLRLCLQGRRGLGSIYVWAVGNGRSHGDSCATDGYVSSIYTIAVGSVNQWGQRAYYDEACSAKMAVTFNYNKNSKARDERIQVVSVTMSHN